MMARRKAKGLTERQKRILEVLEKFQDRYGYPPSIREIGEEAEISSTSVVNYYLEQLKENGYIERDDRVSRGIRLLKPLADATASFQQKVQDLGEAVADMLHIPIVGRIVAGSPVPVPSSDFAYYDSDSIIDFPVSLLPSREQTDDLFALEVQGDSMIDALVNDGDIVIMKPTKNARNGEMVAVWLNDKEETTLKYFYHEKGRVRLQPANSSMDPIYIDDLSTVEIQGKVVMVIRKIKGLVS